MCECYAYILKECLFVCVFFVFVLHQLHIATCKQRERCKCMQKRPLGIATRIDADQCSGIRLYIPFVRWIFYVTTTNLGTFHTPIWFLWSGIYKSMLWYARRYADYDRHQWNVIVTFPPYMHSFKSFACLVVGRLITPSEMVVDAFSRIRLLVSTSSAVRG